MKEDKKSKALDSVWDLTRIFFIFILRLKNKFIFHHQGLPKNDSFFHVEQW